MPTYTRIIKHLDTDASTVIADISANVTAASFELLRIGGCGAGEITLKDSFADRGTIDIGDHIQISYSSGDVWYLGRVEGIQEDSPSVARVTLFGLWASLAEVYPGGYAEANLGQPHRYARSDWFVNDPDHKFQTFDVVSQPDSMVNLLFSQYITETTRITLGTVNTSALPNPLDSFIFHGNESAQEILRMLAIYTRDASVGVDETGALFFTPRNTTLLQTFQEGVDCESLSRSRDRKLFYNRLLLTGGYVYLGPNNSPGFFRFGGNYQYTPSIATYGEKVAQIFVPWVRRNQDATTFAKEFFTKYGNPVTRLTLTCSPQSTLLKPWSGEIEVQDRDGTVLVRDRFEKIKVHFDHKPYFEIELGPEDLQFPPFPQDREIPKPSAMPFDPPGVFTGFSFSGSPSVVQSSYSISGCVAKCSTPLTYDIVDDGGAVWSITNLDNMFAVDGTYANVVTLAGSPSAMAIDFRGYSFTATPGAVLGVRVEVHGFILSGPGATVKVALIGPNITNPVYLDAKPLTLSAGDHVDFGSEYAGGESWKLEVPLDSTFVNDTLFGVRMKLTGADTGSTILIDSVKVCVSEDCFASSASQQDTPGTSTQECIAGIGGVPWDNVKVEEDGDVVYVLGLNAAGCMVRVPLGQCSSG